MARKSKTPPKATRQRRNPDDPKRRAGGRMNPESLDAQLLARGLGTRDLSRLAKLDMKTIGAARKGQRVSRETVMRIVAALDLVPVNPTTASLVGISVAQNGGSEKKTGGVDDRRSREVAAHARNRPTRV